MTSLFDKHPDLRNFDLIIVECSGGKDSAAMMAVMREKWDDLPSNPPEAFRRPPIITTHVSITDFDWPDVTDVFRNQCEMLKMHGRIDERKLLPLVLKRRMWPSPKCRYCTSDVKRVSLGVMLRELANETKAKRILRCEGVRADESPRRSRLMNYEKDKLQSNSKRDVWIYRPIFRWADTHVWDRIDRYKLPTPRCYKFGFLRCGCPFCIYAKKYHSDLAATLPELRSIYASIREVEHEIGHTLYHNRPWPHHAEKIGAQHA